MSLADYILKRVHIDSNGCWIWTLAPGVGGYGQAQVDGVHYRAHRLAFEVWNGPIPEGMCVCHRCDVRMCVNPVHLWLGTHADNNHDAKAKGRTNKGDKNGMRVHAGLLAGSRHPQARFTEEDIREIRRLHSLKTPRREIAQRYGTSVDYVGQIVGRTAWKHVL